MRLSSASTTVACVLLAGSAMAQTAAPQGRPPPPAPPKVGEPAPKTPVEKAAETVASLVRFYGTIKPTTIVSFGALESFSQPNASAETAAGNPALAVLPDESRATFQVAQSRVGLFVGEQTRARAQVEFDFVDFTKASPTVASVPRLRIAKVEWEPVPKLVLALGQDWDLHGPLNPYGSNLVGGNFQAGNTGFMRQQIKLIYTAGTVAEIAGAVGLQVANPTPKDASVEIHRVPTAALRAAWLLGKSRVGLSGIVTQLRLALNTPDQRDTAAYSGMVYADIEPAPWVHIKAEIYLARNLANLGSLALSQASIASGDLDEAGGFVSARGVITPEHAVFLTCGVAQILNSSRVVPSYSYVANVATASGTGPGMQSNLAARVGYEFRPLKALAFSFEAFIFRSRHVLQPVDQAKYDSTRVTPGLELAAFYTF